MASAPWWQALTRKLFHPQSSEPSSLSWPPTFNYKPSTFKFIDSPVKHTFLECYQPSPSCLKGGLKSYYPLDNSIGFASVYLLDSDLSGTL